MRLKQIELVFLVDADAFVNDMNIDKHIVFVDWLVLNFNFDLLVDFRKLDRVWQQVHNDLLRPCRVDHHMVIEAVGREVDPEAL